MFRWHGQDQGDAGPRTIPILQIDEKLRKEQTAKFAALRGGRDHDKVRWALDGLRQAALGDDPFGKDLLMPHILKSVKAYATLGETIGVLRETWSEYVEQNII